SAYYFFFFSSRRRHTRFSRDWSSDVCSSDLDSASHDGQEAYIHDPRVKHQADELLRWLDDLVDKTLHSKKAGLTKYWDGKNAPRSEERRVGKECRSRWSRDRQRIKEDETRRR